MKHDIFSLKGRVALVTGGNQGIGKVVSQYLADAGADIVILDLNDAAEVAKGIASEYGVRAAAYVCDVTRQSDVKAAVARAAQEMGSLDILFNNAGIVQHKPVLDLEPGEWERVLNVNLNGVFYVAHAFANWLAAHGKGGSIINTASMSGTIVNIPQEQASYNTSKAAVVHLTKSLAVELAPKGIRVNSISPGYIATELIEFVRQDWKDYWQELIPFKRLGKPEELAGAVIYLASDASSYTSGSDLIIDGCFTVI
ncbi:MAG: SDR family oxidoreductase [Clostridiales bacterium]|jgi:NAD(P)-dependent dehydrogenase (short-subunit alcohol dehydrogenase family)|nr:SDR family oxidoreductase [Clostridiales bacterium]